MSSFRNVRTIALGILVAGSSVLQGTLVHAAPPPPPIIVDGSTTVYPISVSAQSQYQASTGTAFSIFYTGSGHGQQSLLNDYVHIANSSSACSSANAFVPNPAGFSAGTYVNSATASTFGCGVLTANIVGQDALSIITHPSKASCITSITLTQTQQIWEGLITNWNQLGSCASAPIVPRARILASGTRPSFLALAKLCGSSVATACLPSGQTEDNVIAATGLPRLQGNAQMTNDIQNNPDQIGYTSLGFDVGVNVLALNCSGWSACPNGSPSLPTAANVLANSYPMARKLFMYTAPGAPAAVTNYINFILGPQGQAVVANVGYVPVGPQLAKYDIEGNGCADIGDVTVLGSFWQKTGPVDPFDPEFPVVRGWTRADVNFDGIVDIADVATFGANWQKGC